VGKTVILRAVAVGALLAPLPAGAQETAPGGVVMTFGVQERLSAGRNLVLDVPAEGRTIASDTTLSFGVTSTTPLSRLSVTGSAALRIADEPGGSVTDLEQPRLSFVYGRESVDAALEVTGNYRRDRVDFLRDLTSFLDEEGNLDLPDDFGDLEGSGTRADYALDARLETGRTAPLGFILEAGVSGIDYQDTAASADLDDIRRQRLSGTARLAFSPLSEGRVTVERRSSDEDDALETAITTDRIELGLRQEISPRSRFDAGLGYSIATTEELGVETDEVKGATARFGYEWDMPDGRIDARFETSVTDDGRRSGLSFGRALDLPRGSLSARIGISKGEDQDAGLTGSLAWRQALPDGAISASLDRSLASTDTGEAETTRLALNWNRQITDLSGVTLGLNYATVSETGEADVARAGVTASYNRALTEDWGMNLGLAWRMRDEDGAGRATSEEVFLSIGREFTWRR